MASATRQMVGADAAGVTALQINITATLAGSIICVGSILLNSSPLLVGLPTDSGSQTYTNAVGPNAQGSNGQRIDHVLNSASGITSVTIHQTSTANCLTGIVAELTGTANAVRGSVPAQTTGSSTTAATNTVTSTAGDIAVAVVSDLGGSSTVYTVSPVAFTMASYTPNGSNERGGGAHADNMSATTTGATFTLPTAGHVAGIVLYQGGGGAPAAIPNRIVSVLQAVQRAANW